MIPPAWKALSGVIVVLNPEAVVTAQDLSRLKKMIRSMRTVGDPYRAYLDALDRRLNRARIVDVEDVGGQVVTMHSRVRLRDEAGGRSHTTTLVYPDEASPFAAHLSVVTSLGTALLGSIAGSRIEWRANRGKNTVRLEEVVSQPSDAVMRLAELVKE